MKIPPWTQYNNCYNNVDDLFGRQDKIIGAYDKQVKSYSLGEIEVQVTEYHKKNNFSGKPGHHGGGYDAGRLRERRKRYPVVYISDGQDVFRDEDIL